MQRPRIKPEHRAFRPTPDRIRIGGRIYGIAAEIEDPSGRVWELIQLLDGSRSVDRIVTDLIHRCPGLDADEVRAGIGTLTEAGYVEDAADEAPSGLSDEERDRYSRNQAFYRGVDLTPRESTWHAQLALKNARVLLVGVGGTGNAVATSLVASGVGELHLVDPDVLELSNLSRQVLYTESDLGRAKVDAALDHLRARNSHVRLSAERRWITGVQDFLDLLPGYDVLALCADKPGQIRSWANQACLTTGTPWAYGGYFGPQVIVGAYRPGTGPCYDCLLLQENELNQERNLNDWLVTGDLPEVTGTTAVSAGMCGQLVAHACMSFVTGAPALPVNCVYGVNLVSPDQRYVLNAERPRPDCPACAPAAPHAVAAAGGRS